MIMILISLFKVTNSYANELVFWGTWETIKELKQSIKELDKEKNILNKDLNTLNTDYKLKSFLRNNISKSEFIVIKKIVSTYNLNKETVELSIYNDAKKNLSILDNRKKLLEEKRVFYKWLIPFIQTKSKKDYLAYIKKDATIFNKQNIVNTDIVVKKDLLENKVNRIEDTILKHQKFINNSIKNIIETRLDSKINNLKTNSTFKVLNNESKVKVLNKTIIKIKIKLENLQISKWNTNSWILINSTISDNILIKKIKTYNIAISKLELFKNQFIK